MTELSHSVISPMSFRLEYKRGSTGPTMFQRYVRIQVDVNPICKQGDVADLLFAITFTLLSGEFIESLCIRNFADISELFWRQHSSLPSDMRAHSSASLLKTLPECDESPQPKTNNCAADPTANVTINEHFVKLSRCISGKYLMRIGRLERSSELSRTPKRNGERSGDVLRLQHHAGETAPSVRLIEQKQQRRRLIVHGHKIR